MKADFSELAAMKQIRDGLNVTICNGDVEAGIRLLKRRMATDGTLRRLKTRVMNPKRSDRRKIKAARSERHRARHQERRAATDSRSKSK